MNYFDRLMTPRPLPPFALLPVPSATPTVSLSGVVDVPNQPDPTQEAVLLPSDLPTMPQAQPTMADYAPVDNGTGPAQMTDTSLPAQTAQPQVQQAAPAPVQLAQATPARAVAQPAQIAPQPSPQAAPAPSNPVFDGNNAHADMSPEQEKRNADVRNIIANAVANKLPHSVLETQLAPYGIHVSDLKNLEVNEAAVRADPRAVVQVATDDQINRVNALHASLDKDYHVAPTTDGQSVVLRTHHDPVTQLGALGYGIGQGVTLGAADEGNAALGATLNSAANLVGQGTPVSWADAYHYLHGQAQANVDDAQSNYGGTFLAGQVAGGLLPTLATAGGDSPALAAGGLRAAGRLAADGAGYGAITGFNSADGGLVNRLEGAGYGAAGGAAAGALIGTPINAVARRVAANVEAGGNAGKQALDAADRLNTKYGETADPVRLVLGNTSHGGLASAATGALDDTAIAGRIAGLHTARQNIDNSAGQVGQAIADSHTPGGASDLVTTAASQIDPANPGSLGAYNAETKAAAQSIYGKADALAGKAQIPTPQLVGALRGIIDNWQRNPGLRNDGAIGSFQTLLNRLLAGEPDNAGKTMSGTGMNVLNSILRNPEGVQSAPSASAKWTAAGLRDLRTTFGDDLDQASGQPTGASRYAHEAADKLWGPLSQDIQTGLRQSGNAEAAGLYRQADQQWATRVSNLKAINKLLGKPQDGWSPDRVAQNIMTASQKDYGSLGTALNAINPEHADEIRGSIIQNLGRNKSGTALQPSDEKFNLGTFTTKWNDMSDEAKAAVFKPQTVSDLNDLAKIGYSQRASGQLMNGSRTSYANDFIQTILRGSEAIARWGSGGYALATHQVIPAIAGTGGLYATGRFLASPGIARKLVNFSNSGNVATFSRGLARSAARNPAISSTVSQILGALNSGDAPATSNAPAPSSNPFDQFDSHTDKVDLNSVPTGGAKTPNPFDQFDGHTDNVQL